MEGEKQTRYILGTHTHLNFLSAPIMPISMFFPEICPSNLENTHNRKQKRKIENVLGSSLRNKEHKPNNFRTQRKVFPFDTGYSLVTQPKTPFSNTTLTPP